jgi:drug/metabolite transporter (DMT)-like permease
MSQALPRPGVRPATRAGPAIGAMIAGMALVVAMDSLAKWLGRDYAIAQIVFFRQAFSLPPLLLLTLYLGGWSALATRRPFGHGLRGLLGVAAAFCFFLSLVYLPIAEATAIAFVSPLLMTALSAPILGEKVGRRRWSAVLLGFIGVLVVVRPGSGVFGWPALLPLGAALCYALAMLWTRQMARSETLAALLVLPTLIAAILTAPPALAVWTPPTDAETWVLFALLGLLGGMGMAFLTQAFRLAPSAATVAPFDYTALVWATLAGWLVWGEFPDAFAILGAAVIVASGLFVIHRERRLEKSLASRRRF